MNEECWGMAGSGVECWKQAGKRAIVCSIRANFSVAGEENVTSVDLIG
ncbi:MAG: hypothetical protein R3C59_01530 [Planctomycetaceae bacterium]